MMKNVASESSNDKNKKMPSVVTKKYSKILLTLDNVLLPKEKTDNSPSKLDGLDESTELDLRVMGCELIQTSGILLKLPQVNL